jgi:polysaccharide export outer membrane protein
MKASHRYSVNIIRGAWMALLLVIAACSNPVAHIRELKPEDLAIKPVKRLPLEQTYKMVPYDVLAIRFTYHPEQDPKGPISIRPDGQVTIEGVGTIPAAGLTPDELGKEIAQLTSKRLRDPQVVVTVSQFAPRKIYVGGEVKNPGIVQFQGDISPMQAIFERGGFTSEAQMDSVILIRNAGSPDPIIGRINVNQALENAKPEQISLLTEDVLYVPMSGIARADLWVRQHLNDIIPSGLLGVGGFAAGIR